MCMKQPLSFTFCILGRQKISPELSVQCMQGVSTLTQELFKVEVKENLNNTQILLSYKVKPKGQKKLCFLGAKYFQVKTEG